MRYNWNLYYDEIFIVKKKKEYKKKRQKTLEWEKNMF